VAVDLLEGLERIGDGRALDAARTCAKSGDTPDIRERAARLVPILEERLRRANDAADLLRPASAPGAETLLRPASAGDGTPPERLLRPVEEPIEQQAAGGQRNPPAE